MRRAAASGRRPPRRWTGWVFAVVEVAALVAVPVVALIGVQALLDTRAGTFVAGPGPDDPGFQALVDPSPVQVVLEQRDGVLTGVTLLTRAGADADGGAAVLVPAELQVEGQTLLEWSEAGDLAAAEALGRALRLRLGDPVVLDEAAWRRLLGTSTVEIDNPDPVIVDGELERFEAGRLELTAEDLPDWLGLSANQEAAALAFRRRLLWEALLDEPEILSSDAEPGGALARIAAGPHVVEPLPVQVRPNAVTLDAEAAEELVVDTVPFPAGARPGDRLRVRVLDRTGSGDLDEIARTVARAGGEVVMVGNAAQFDSAATEAVISDPALDDPTRRLLARMGTGTVRLSPGSDDTIDVTVLAGPDLVGRGSAEPAPERGTGR